MLDAAVYQLTYGDLEAVYSCIAVQIRETRGWWFVSALWWLSDGNFSAEGGDKSRVV
jgi:hypothetical protein